MAARRWAVAGRRTSGHRSASAPALIRRMFHSRPRRQRAVTQARAATVTL
jgi:hypothetical protein